MALQRVRHDNLLALVDDLRRQGCEDWTAMAGAVGNIVTAERLEALSTGAAISAWTAAGFEHALRKPRGWMDEDRHPPTDEFDPSGFPR